MAIGIGYRRSDRNASNRRCFSRYHQCQRQYYGTGKRAAAPAGGKAAPTRTVELGYQQRKEMTSRHRKVEKRIMEAEPRQTELAATMSDPAHATDYEILSAASSEAAALADELASLYEEWGRLGEALGTTAD